MTTIPLTIDTIRSATKPNGDPSQLLYFLQRINERCSQLQNIVDKQSKTIEQLQKSINPTDILQSANRELGVRGKFPLNVTGLHGKLAEAQPSALLLFTADPTLAASNIDANLYEVGQIATYGGYFYYVQSGNPHTWSLLTLSVTVHNLLSVTHSDTLAAAVVRGDLVVGNSTPKWSRLGKGGANQGLFMDSGGTDPGWRVVPDAALSANVPLLSSGVLTLTSQFAVRVYNSVNQSLTDSVITALTFDSESFDRGSCHSTSSNTSRITIPTGGAGLWLLLGQVQYASSTTGVRLASIYANGATLHATTQTPPLSGNVTSFPVPTIVSVVDGDFFELSAYQSSGGPLDAVSGVGKTWFAGYKLC